MVGGLMTIPGSLQVPAGEIGRRDGDCLSGLCGVRQCQGDVR